MAKSWHRVANASGLWLARHRAQGWQQRSRLASLRGAARSRRSAARPQDPGQCEFLGFSFTGGSQRTGASRPRPWPLRGQGPAAHAPHPTAVAPVSSAVAGRAVTRLVEHLAHTEGVGGSSPSQPTRHSALRGGASRIWREAGDRASAAVPPQNESMRSHRGLLCDRDFASPWGCHANMYHHAVGKP
jgi:hypothetical protein